MEVVVNAVSNTSLTGAAGEYFVMSQLLRRGYIAALAPAGVPNCDIVVTDKIGDRLCAIQVKTRANTGRDGGWHMGKKHETLVSPGLFYCFVDFAVDQKSYPFTYVVPAKDVAEALKASHLAWLTQPGRGGQARKDTDMRRFLPDYSHLELSGYSAGWLDPFLEAWEQLGAD